MTWLDVWLIVFPSFRLFDNFTCKGKELFYVQNKGSICNNLLYAISTDLEAEDVGWANFHMSL